MTAGSCWDQCLHLSNGCNTSFSPCILQWLQGTVSKCAMCLVSKAEGLCPHGTHAWWERQMLNRHFPRETFNLSCKGKPHSAVRDGCREI